MVLLRLDGDHQLDIPAGARDFVVTDRFELPVDVQVLAVYPHAHFLARTMEAHATLPDGREQPLIRIDAWDFKWQDVYRYAQPLRLPKGTVISFRYTYDNSAENPRNPSRPPKRVVAGMRSSDEMARLQLQVRPDRAEDVATLRSAFYLHLVRKAPDDPWVHYELANLFRDSQPPRRCRARVPPGDRSRPEPLGRTHQSRGRPSRGRAAGRGRDLLPSRARRRAGLRAGALQPRQRASRQRSGRRGDSALSGSGQARALAGGRAQQPGRDPGLPGSVWTSRSGTSARP